MNTYSIQVITREGMHLHFQVSKSNWESLQENLEWHIEHPGEDHGHWMLVKDLQGSRHLISLSNDSSVACVTFSSTKDVKTKASNMKADAKGSITPNVDLDSPKWEDFNLPVSKSKKKRLDVLKESKKSKVVDSWDMQTGEVKNNPSDTDAGKGPQRRSKRASKTNKSSKPKENDKSRKVKKSKRGSRDSKGSKAVRRGSEKKSGKANK